MATASPLLDGTGNTHSAAVGKLAALLEGRHDAIMFDNFDDDDGFAEDTSDEELEDDELFAQARLEVITGGNPVRPTTAYPSVPINPTREIRIVQVQPGDYWEPICCELRVQSLDLGPQEAAADPFEALSYTWGGWTDFETITLGEVEDFPITCNLFAALKRLRSSTKIRRLWIDQLSIDQGAEHEKGQQIAIMDQVYRQAARVTIWLGDAPDEGLDQPASGGFLRSQLRHAVTWTQPSWPTRAWILQEYAMAKADPSVCFGAHELRWSNFLDLFIHPSLLYSGSKLVVLSLQLLNLMKIRDQADDRSLLTVAWTIRQMESSIPQDKVFSLLPLLAPEIRSRIHVDYDKSIASLFAETTYAALTSGAGLAALMLAGRKHHSGSNLPSWAIDFRSQIMPLTLSVEEAESTRPIWYPIKLSRKLTVAFDRHMLAMEWEETCQALHELTRDLKPWCQQQPQLSADMSFDADRRTLKIRAVHLDVVGYVAPQKEDSGLWRQTFQALREAMNRESRECMSTTDDAYDRLRNRRTCLPPLRHCPSCGKPFTALEIIEHIWRWEGVTMPGLFNRRAKGIIDSQLYLKMETLTIRKYHVFTTSHGFLAVGTFLLDTGDSIVLPYGSRFPFALRKLEGGGWMFLGFVYVFGVMQGELMGDEFRGLSLEEGDYVLH